MRRVLPSVAALREKLGRAEPGSERRAGFERLLEKALGQRRCQESEARWSTCLLLLAVQRRRVESLVLGALSSSPVHRALVLVLGTNIAVLLDCSKSCLDSVAFLAYLLTYEK